MKVIFRKEKNGVIAFFPETYNNREYFYGLGIMCYAHIGQHSEASIEYYHSTLPCPEADYKSLYNELIEIGYELEVVKRIIRKG